jgi:glyoxylate reductase
LSYYVAVSEPSGPTRTTAPDATRRPIACVALTLGAAALRRIEDECDVRAVDPRGDRSAILADLTETEGLLCSAQFPIDEALLRAAPNLRVISNFGVGYNNVDVGAATARGIAVCNTPGVLSDAVADLTIALILNISRRLVTNLDYARNGDWTRQEPLPPLGFDVADKTLGIVGFGRIGRAVARRAHAFGMRILFHDVITAAPEIAACEYRPFDDLLREADFVSLHVNLTPETERLIGARELSLMRPSAYLVNTSRGPVVDQPALVAALHNGGIAGAALDVLSVEPPPPGDPILSAPNVLILPHTGSATLETRAAMLDLAISNLLAVLRGDAPPSCVNAEALTHSTDPRRAPRRPFGLR